MVNFRHKDETIAITSEAIPIEQHCLSENSVYRAENLAMLLTPPSRELRKHKNSIKALKIISTFGFQLLSLASEFSQPTKLN